MGTDAPTIDLAAALALLIKALEDKKISADACEHIRAWLTERRFRPYEPLVRQHIAEGRWRELDDAFWTVLPFGTGGRRGRMYPIGSATINDRTIGESALGLAEYVKQQSSGGQLSCAIAYDTRHRSRHFAELSARIMVAAGLKVYFLDDYRSTPELSFLVRMKQCSCGIMVSASHNSPSDNAVKVYWNTGGQILPPHDQRIIEQVMNAGEIDVGAAFSDSIKAGQIEICTALADAAFTAEVVQQGFSGPRTLKIIYSPLHGVGQSAVFPVLRSDGFEDVEIFAPHRQPDGDFPNVPGHVANPENPEVFEAMIERARAVGADLVLATDPDCDRLGCAAPLTADPAGAWRTFTGNQIAVLLADYVLARRGAAGTLSVDHYLAKTLVTTEMLRRIGDSYGVRTLGDLLVGFKWIGGLIDDEGPERFVLGCEESHGYLVGQYARDKDGAVAAMLLAESSAKLKSEGQSLHQRLDDLYRQHGYHAEKLLSTKMEGSAGMQRMQQLMSRFRQHPPESLAGMKVVAVRDYLHSQTFKPGGQPRPLTGPTGDMVILDLAEQGNYIAVRPSGTEPKVKFYLFAYAAAEQWTDLESVKDKTQHHLANVEADLERFAKTDE